MSRPKDDPSTQFMEVETLQRHRPAPARRLSKVVVVEGRDAGKHLVVDPSAPLRLLVGTSPICDLVLTDPTVSRRHFALEPEPTRHRLRDLGSTNGTYLEGMLVVEAFVQGHETIRVGGTTLRLESESAARTPLPERSSFGGMIGESPPMRRLFGLAERVARLDLPVLIEGPRGAGKELLAETIHQTSHRAAAAFVVLDCGATSTSSLESELLGDDRGERPRAGAVHEAGAGTLVLDEIAHLDLRTQAKLLRLLDAEAVHCVGGARRIRSSARIMATSTRDLDREVAAGRFHEGLLRRLASCRLELPPLSARTGDVAVLARHFVVALGGDLSVLGGEVLAQLVDYPWTGNVAELRDAVAQLVVLGEETAGFQPVANRRGAAPRATDWLDDWIDTEPRFPILRRRVLEAFEERFVARLLATHGGNVTHAAAASGIALRYFRMLKSRAQR